MGRAMQWPATAVIGSIVLLDLRTLCLNASLVSLSLSDCAAVAHALQCTTSKWTVYFGCLFRGRVFCCLLLVSDQRIHVQLSDCGSAV